MVDHLVGEYLLGVPLPFTLGRAEGRGALVIVETRPSFFLPHVVASAVRTHPGWRLYVFGTREVHALLGSRCTDYEAATVRVLLRDGRMSSAEYSALLLSDAFWSVLREEHALVFQADCVLVRPTPPHCLRFDYIGAACGELDPRNFVMNGGLSLRRVAAMRAAVAGMQRGDGTPEDVAFCEQLRRTDGAVLPGLEDCHAFAIESLGNPATAIGLHGTDKYYAPRELVAALLTPLTRPQTAPAQT